MNPRGSRAGARGGAAGFTLMEVLITLVIVAILATIAVSSYRNQMLRANRAAAQGYLLEVANLQERFLLDNRAYAGALADLGTAPPPEVSRNYTVTIPAATLTTTTYSLQAAPTAAQAKDGCGTLSLDSTGTRGAAASNCWR